MNRSKESDAATFNADELQFLLSGPRKDFVEESETTKFKI